MTTDQKSFWTIARSAHRKMICIIQKQGWEAEPNDATIVNIMFFCLFLEFRPAGAFLYQYTAISQACSDANLVKQLLMFFNAMKKVHWNLLETQNDACLVDMYGRAGLLEEAEAF
ncbi:hypothetical protein ACLB2K_037849 [Fragaria x ananassa]